MTGPTAGAVPAGVGTAPVDRYTLQEARALLAVESCAKRGHCPVTVFGQHTAHAAAARPITCECGKYLWSAVTS
jgi:hypothetical protein